MTIVDPIDSYLCSPSDVTEKVTAKAIELGYRHVSRHKAAQRNLAMG